MKKVYMNRLQAWKNTAGVLNQNQTLWAGNAHFSAAVYALNTALQSIDSRRQAQMAPVQASTAMREQLAQSALQKVLRIAKCTSALARVQHNEGLRTAVQLSLHRLAGARLADRTLMLRSVLQQAAPYASTLQGVGITAADFADAAQAVDAYEAALFAPRESIVHHAAETQGIRLEFRKAGDAVRVIDDLLILFGSHTDFLHALQSARVVTGAPKRGEESKKAS